MHRLLARQLRKHLNGSDDVPDELRALVDAVDKAYEQADADRRMLERSLELSSGELLEANQQLVATVQAFPDPMFVIDAEGTVVDARSSALSGSYAEPECFIGGSIRRVPGIGDANIRGMRDHADETGLIQGFEYALDEAGRERWFEARVVPLVTERTVVLVREVTEQVRAKGALRRALAQLEERVKELQSEVRTRKEAEKLALESSRLKSEFLATISHELRTPLNHVIGMTELVLDDDLSGQQREYLGVVHSSACMLAAIVSELLDYSKLEAGMVVLRREPLALRSCVDTATRSFASRARARSLVIESNIADDVPAVVIGDQQRIGQVLKNLVGNAIKFTDSGGVRLDVTAHDGRGREWLHFAVSDTGIGIEPEDLERIFELFVQADGSTSRQREGVGLGLAITRKLVAQMGGTIWVESEAHQGSVFHVELPLERPTVGSGFGAA